MVISQNLLRKTTLIILSALLSLQNVFSFSVVRVLPQHSQVEIKNPGYFTAAVFVKMSAKEFGAATGKRLNVFQRIYFKVLQHKVKRDLKKNPHLVMTDYMDPKNGKFKFDFLWFVIASIIGPFGVLLAYTSHQKQKKELTTRKDKITSAWLGFLFWILWFGWLFIF